MSSTVIYPIVSVSCFLIAIFFFRKENVPLIKALPFIITSMSPHKIKEVFRNEGIWLIVMGFVNFIIYMIIF